MPDFDKLDQSYLENLTDFLYSAKWMFNVLNTQYINFGILEHHRNFINLLSTVDLNSFPELANPQREHPQELRELISQVNNFKITFDTINTDSWRPTPVRKISIKKQYEIENVSRVINEICSVDGVDYLVDFGSGLGYLTHHIADRFGFRALGLESGAERVVKAREHQKKYSNSLGRVKHVQHFITSASEEFILSQLEDSSSELVIFGLHGCGDLTVTAVNLFLNMQRASKIIFMPCCYHKMTSEHADYRTFNHFPLSKELKSILSEKYSSDSNFLNRPFLRLAGQQSPSKWREMSDEEHWIHGKNMFERALVEALMLDDDETTKRVNNTTIPDGPVKFDDIKLKYQLLVKSSGKSKDWTAAHERRFDELREKHPDGETMSERLFCLQTTIQRVCENLVLMDRVRYIEEQGGVLNLKLRVSVKKLENEKLSPRCLILIAEKLK